MLLIFTMVACMYVGSLAGRDMGLREAREDAIKAGVGRWEEDPETKTKRFVFGIPK